MENVAARSDRWAMVPRSVVLNADIDRGAMLVLLALATYVDHSHDASPTPAQLAQAAGLDADMVRDHLETLRALELVSWTHQDDGPTTYQLLYEFPEAELGSVRQHDGQTLPDAMRTPASPAAPVVTTVSAPEPVVLNVVHVTDPLGGIPRSQRRKCSKCHQGWADRAGWCAMCRSMWPEQAPPLILRAEG